MTTKKMLFFLIILMITYLLDNNLITLLEETIDESKEIKKERKMHREDKSKGHSQCFV